LWQIRLAFPGTEGTALLIPFRGVEESIAYFKKAAQVRPGGAAAFGDDMEKFGVWPGTFAHCYEAGWLENFFQALDENASWLKILTPSEYIASHVPLGRADLPSASYAEMMEWVLPTETRLRYFALHKDSRGVRTCSPLFAAARGADSSANIRNPICSTRKCCGFPLV